MGRVKQEATETAEWVIPERDEYEIAYDAYMTRNTALEHALALHKTNGGMKTVHQVLTDAEAILNFLKGESNE